MDDNNINNNNNSNNDPPPPPQTPRATLKPSKRTLHHRALTLATLEGHEPAVPAAATPPPTYDAFVADARRRKRAIPRLFPEVLLQPDGAPPLHIDRHFLAQDRRRRIKEGLDAWRPRSCGRGEDEDEGEGDEDVGFAPVARRRQPAEDEECGGAVEPGSMSSSKKGRASGLRRAKRLPLPLEPLDAIGEGENACAEREGVAGRAGQVSFPGLPPPSGPPPQRLLPHTPVGALSIGFWEGEDGDANGDSNAGRSFPAGVHGYTASSVQRRVRVDTGECESDRGPVRT